MSVRSRCLRRVQGYFCMQTIARSMADTGPMGGRYMPHAPPIVGRYGKCPHSRMRRLQLRTVQDLISSPRAFAGRSFETPCVTAPRLTARGPQALLLVGWAVVVHALTVRFALSVGRPGRDRLAVDGGRAPRLRIIGK